MSPVQILSQIIFFKEIKVLSRDAVHSNLEAFPHRAWAEVDSGKIYFHKTKSELN